MLAFRVATGRRAKTCRERHSSRARQYSANGGGPGACLGCQAIAKGMHFVQRNVEQQWYGMDNAELLSSKDQT